MSKCLTVLFSRNRYYSFYPQTDKHQVLHLRMLDIVVWYCLFVHKCLACDSVCNRDCETHCEEPGCQDFGQNSLCLIFNFLLRLVECLAKRELNFICLLRTTRLIAFCSGSSSRPLDQHTHSDILYFLLALDHFSSCPISMSATDVIRKGNSRLA